MNLHKLKTEAEHELFGNPMHHPYYWCACGWGGDNGITDHAVEVGLTTRFASLFYCEGHSIGLCNRIHGVANVNCGDHKL